MALFFSRMIKAVTLAGVTAFFGCTQKSGPPLSPLAEQGKRIYSANCIACHNSNPRLNGPVGPDLAGSSLELVRLRVVEGHYPAGYKPKRQTNSMAPFPHLKNEVEALHEFLALP